MMYEGSQEVEVSLYVEPRETIGIRAAFPKFMVARQNVLSGDEVPKAMRSRTVACTPFSDFFRLI